jgi:pimeloyl-ACP methyl ester carboxylesterase
MGVTASPARSRARRWAIRAGVTIVVLVVLLIAACGAYLGWDRLRPVRVAVTVPGFTVDAGGVATHVEHWPAARPSGLAPLVLVPGFSESTYVWSRVAPLLAADRDVYAYDVRGYGFTDHVPPYDLAADTDQLAGLVAALHLERPIVVGHSSGVAIALSLALRAPASLGGVVAANGDGTPYFGADRSAAGGGRSGLRRLLVDPLASAAVTAVVRHRAPIRSLVGAQCGPGCPIDDAAIDRWRAPFLRPGGVSAFVSVLRRPLIGLTDAQESTIAVPAAVLFSSEDSTFDRASALATAGRLHTGLVAELAGARHLALLGEPERFAAALGPLLAALGGR